ncbi:IS110 family transposase [Idiomarina sp. M1R2S28]|uniref:IS110 family transposase n=1 Tax=Idiomarina rhizosphaerae TaxID=2961572 RepID=A0A9X2FZ69_9GAMM|nr:IS110 family transposase [Idiomarina rhizosphaerae]MCP1340345.1 IS110 family transposase [Idiomarina rhizosphaerae]
MDKVISVIGIDLAKNVFQVCAANNSGKRLFNRSVSRAKLLPMLANIPKCIVGMEACSSSHYWAREIEQLGHEVKLMPPQYVKPYVKTNKNDATDADAICEAVVRPSMRFVAIKSVEQQALMLLHRDRRGLVRDRTSLVNRLRAMMGEFGVIAPVGLHKFRSWLKEEYGAVESQLPELLRRHIHVMVSRLWETDEHIALLESEIHGNSSSAEDCKRLGEVPGIGPLTAYALVASLGDIKSFSNGRAFAAWLGLVPKQYSSGGKNKLQGISKRGDSYLRSMLIHGARAVIRHLNPKRTVSRWLRDLLCRRHKNVVIVALANKLARIVWALLSKGTKYQESYSC